MQPISAGRRAIKVFLAKRGVFMFRGLGRGTQVVYDFRRWLPNHTFLTLFDVGANIGSSSLAYLNDFPHARIWCFEPSSRNFVALAKLFEHQPRVTCEQLAFGSVSRMATLVCTNEPTMCHLEHGGQKLPEAITTRGSETVQVLTLDEYCATNDIKSIDFLKIDTEGHDLEVLRGAASLLANGVISCIQCECSMSIDNKFHAAFEDIKQCLEAHGYRLFGVYDQTAEMFLGAPNIRRADVVFISPHVREANLLDK